MPLYREAPTPFILLPKVHILIEVNWATHLSDPTKLTTCINLHLRKKGQDNQKNGINLQFHKSLVRYTDQEEAELEVIEYSIILETHRKEKKDWAASRFSCSYSLSLFVGTLELLVFIRCR